MAQAARCASLRSYPSNHATRWPPGATVQLGTTVTQQSARRREMSKLSGKPQVTAEARLKPSGLFEVGVDRDQQTTSPPNEGLLSPKGWRSGDVGLFDAEPELSPTMSLVERAKKFETIRGREE